MVVGLCRRRRSRVVLGAAAALFLCLAQPARAQFSGVQGADPVRAGHITNLFASWTGSDAFDGVVVTLPPEWTLASAEVLRYGYEPVQVQVHRREDGAYVVSAPRSLRGPHELIFRVAVGEAVGVGRWRIVPFVRRGQRSRRHVVPRDAFEAVRVVRTKAPEVAPDNRVLSFGDPRGDGDVLLLRREALPDLGLRAAHTVAFWMRTTALGEVVASTWDGDERSAYPFELLVDQSGRLLYYRGRPGEHHAMTSRVPVADGAWHHVAYTHDPGTGWSRMYVDGVAVDSLYAEAPLPLDLEGGLAVGGRRPSASESRAALGVYTGELDELGLWPAVRPATVIRASMRQPVGGGARGADGALRLGFEELPGQDVVARRTRRAASTAADLVFVLPIRRLQAAAHAGGVELSWEAGEPGVRAFVVERSNDGRRFEGVGRLTTSDSNDGFSYRFVDRTAAGRILYYRVRQVLGNGSEHITGVIKVGLGVEEAEGATLVGNFPNPFNAATTVMYEVRQAREIDISVWDLAGQQVAQLVRKMHSPGVYEVQFEAGDLPSGTYFVRMQTPGSPPISHKVTLMK